MEPSWIARDAKQASNDQQVKKHERARNFIKRLQAPLRRAKKPSCPPFGFPHFPLLPPANQQRQWFGFWCWDSYFSVESDQQNFPKVCTKYCLLFPPCLSAFFLPSPLSLLLACRNVKAPRHGIRSWTTISGTPGLSRQAYEIVFNGLIQWPSIISASCFGRGRGPPKNRRPKKKRQEKWRGKTSMRQPI